MKHGSFNHRIQQTPSGVHRLGNQSPQFVTGSTVDRRSEHGLVAQHGLDSLIENWLTSRRASRKARGAPLLLGIQDHAPPGSPELQRQLIEAAEDARQLGAEVPRREAQL
mmetsp:Transcript_15469/g.24078  ORF Transcript_15469/g.24078 Transcript_15469/m.24078 type:complete len:110 (+) Transcript_15469:390-719(+)